MSLNCDFTKRTRFEAANLVMFINDLMFVLIKLLCPLGQEIHSVPHFFKVHESLDSIIFSLQSQSALCNAFHLFLQYFQCSSVFFTSSIKKGICFSLHIYHSFIIHRLKWCEKIFATEPLPRVFIPILKEYYNVTSFRVNYFKLINSYILNTVFFDDRKNLSIM